MSETDKSLATRVQAHLRAAGRPVPALPDIIPLIPTGLEELARMIARDDNRSRELRPATSAPFVVAIVAGVGDLSAALAAPNRLLLDFLPDADVRNAATGERVYFAGRDAYALTDQAPFGKFTREGQTILARLYSDDPGASNFTANIIGNFVPTSDELPASCVPDAVIIISRLATALPPEGS